MKKIILTLLAISILLQALFITPTMASSDDWEDIYIEGNTDNPASIDPEIIKAKSAILMDAETGTVLFSKNPNQALPPASVTKIMTLLLVAEEIEKGNITLTDKVLISAEAASMGGSQIFLKEGEEFSVEDLLKSAIIASANDAAYALSELIGGNESSFVEMMNSKAKQLKMNNSLFENSTGLDDDTVKHLTSAYDIAIMSRELIKHDIIMKYAQCWQDSIRNGEFILTNTNRLVRYYKGCTGLKTGSTDKAGFCISASAKRDNMHLIAVVMGSDTRDERNNTAKTLLDWGFANYKVYYEAENEIESIPVRKSLTTKIPVYAKDIRFLIGKDEYTKVEKKYELPEFINAPKDAGEVIGKVMYLIDGREIASTDITVNEKITEMTLFTLFGNMFRTILVGKNSEYH